MNYIELEMEDAPGCTLGACSWANDVGKAEKLRLLVNTRGAPWGLANKVRMSGKDVG